MQHRKLWLMAVLLLSATTVFAQQPKKDSLRYPINDRRGDRFTWRNKNPFDLRDTAFIKQTIEYDPVTKQYYIVEKIGNQYYRRPTYLTFEEFYKLQAQQQEADYFRKRANALMALNRKVTRPKFKLFDNLFNRIMGADSTGKVKIDIRPQGNVDIMAGYQGQNIKNPTLPERARKNGGFDFDMNANLNVIANIGEKLKLPINYNTLANFDFENQLKLDYKGLDDEIIKSIEAGNINWQSKGTLIPSTQGLFGIKSQLQFGKWFITGALANQKSTKQSLALQGGAATTRFQKRLDDYEENRHFLLGGYFRENYNKAMSQLPRVNSQVQIMRMEVWVTNRTGATTDARDIVGLTNLGEEVILGASQLPDNTRTPLYNNQITQNPAYRNPSQATALLLGQGLKQVTDFEKTFARKLSPNEYYFNPQVGWISLNQQLQPDEVLAVAYQYTYNGQVYQVGEFSQNAGLNASNGVQDVLYLKLLKATSQRIPSLLWDLMMKNVYSLDVASIQPQDFDLNVMYEEPSKGLKRYLPQTDPQFEGVPLIRILNLDRLNNRLDPQPDGKFDYIEGFTVLSQQGKIIFPVLEPFGEDLERIALQGQPQNVRDSLLYYELYDTIKAIAQTYANKNRYLFQGQVKGSGGSEIYLGAFNVPQGSVSVTAGGQVLTENVDYTVDYNLGSVKIINQSILNSGVPVNVQFENNAGFGIQQRNFMGLRVDYLASDKLSLGASMVRLGERPFFTKMNYGEDPIRNTMYGFDFSYRSQWPGLTRTLDKLPFYSTTASSNITAYGEAAYLKPGHPKQIGKGDEGLVYIDDFEGSKNSIDLRFPWVAWTLASTPAAFPEASRYDDSTYGFNRAKLAWYNIEPILQDKNSDNNPITDNNLLSDPRVRLVNTTELFPNLTPNLGQSQTVTFDLAYYPAEKGPYNFEHRPTVIGADGKFLPNQRKKNWGGIMRNIDQTDFETGNVEFIEFWIQDPFIKNTNPLASGKLLINLGNISEDVLKDGKRFYENGLPTPQIPAQIDSSTWGYQPINPIQITQAFSNDPADRPYQDVGFDGMIDADEIRRHQGYLNLLATNFGITSSVYQAALKDPGNDNYIWYRDAMFGGTVGILERYKNYNNPHGNSPVASTSSEFSAAATMYPDNEDLNRDNTLNENEEYYEYEIDLTQNMGIGNYVVDKRTVNVRYANNTTGNETWYQFRIPVRGYTRKIGAIPDFKSIRFMRMYLTDFQEETVLRFAKLDLVRNQWRTFNYKMDTTGAYLPASTTPLLVSAVNIEENSSKQPVNYVIPCGIERVSYLSNNNVNLLQNEQAMSLQVRNLGPGDAKAVFKTLNLDLRQYGQLSMFMHAESIKDFGQNLDDGMFYAVIRIGQDFLSNYYEIRYPLKVTPPGIYSNAKCDSVWPVANTLDFSIQDLIQLKTRRNGSLVPSNQRYSEVINGKTFAVFGNPNLGEVRGFLVGIENAHTDNMSGEIWINELRLSKMDESGGYAALGRVDVQLADLGSITVSANTYTKGFGTIEQRVNERARDNLFQFDAAATIDAGKLLPKQIGLTIPVYASINKTIRTPEYDPYDLDIKLKDKMNASGNPKQKDSIRNAAIDETTIKTLNLTNVRVAPKGKTRLWSISNLDVSYSYTKFEQTNPLILKNDVTKHRGGLGYTYNAAPKYIEPLKKIRSKTPWLALIRDININLNPSLLSFRADVNRQFGEFVPRIVSDGKIERVDTTYDKYFTFDRFYNMRWDLTRSLNIDFSATNNARVDEPYGRLDTKAKKDTVRENFWNGGRNTLYTQRAVASYTLPLGKLPLTDWITARYSYTTTYNWIGASRLAIDLGNTIENSQDNSINGEFDFSRLYQKSRFLRALEMPSQPRVKGDSSGRNTRRPDVDLPPLPSKSEALKGLTGKARKDALARWREQRRAYRMAKANQPLELGGFVKGAGKFLTMLKRASINYSENYRSRLPGYMDSTRFLGQNWKTMAPGLDYVFGRQPDTAWLNEQAAKGRITRSKEFNFLFQQRFEQRLTLTAQLEPIRELMIDLNLEKSFNKDYSELFKDTTAVGLGKLTHNNPLSAGGFNVSYIAFNTLFEKFKPNEVSNTFKKFEAYRSVISQRLGLLNPYSTGSTGGYAQGYGRYAQDVLIPAFLAAYTGKSPESAPLIKHSNQHIKTNPFKGILPKPNWKLTYTGLTRIPALQRNFSTISVTHGYNGNLSMNSFTSALLFQDPFGSGYPSFVDTISNNFVPYFLVPNITIQEQFAPLIGIDVTTTSQLNIRAEFRKSRQLSLSLIDFQLSELNSTEWTFGLSWRTKGFKLPFKLPFMKDKELENDLNFRLDLAMRDDAQSNSRLDQANAYSTGGQKVITIQPSIDYVLNNRLNLKLFFDQRRVTPYVSTSAPIVNTRAGIQLRIALAQ